MMFLRNIFILVLITITLGCSSLRGEEQFANKVTAPIFTSKLYASQTQTIYVSHEEASHITWMGFVHSNDYDYFKITRVQQGSQTLMAEGMDMDGVAFTPNSNAVIENLSIGASTGGNNEMVDGSINVLGSGDLRISVQYSPLKAIDSEEEPHEAYLVIYYDEPQVGALRVKLEGYTQGVNDEACTRAAETMTPVVYEFQGNAFDFYFCGSEVAAKGQNNTNGNHGASTNITPISTLDASGEPQYFTFYQVDEDTVCLLTEDLTGDAPSIPDFTFEIPEGLAPIDQLTVSMQKFAECDLDPTTGVISCPDDLTVETGVVPVSPLTATNSTIPAEENITTECPDFGDLVGEGTFGSGDMTLVFKGTMLADSNTQAFNIVDALVAAEIQLSCVSGCN